MRIAGFVLRLLVGLLFLFSAVPKLVGGADAAREDLQLATWFWQFTGVVELVGALALLASLWYLRLALVAGVWFVVFMIGALIAHIRVDDPVSVMTFPMVLLVLSALVTVLAGRQARASELEEVESIGRHASPQSPW